jgi:fermentation-respiration switch protein FrsA (DUF1100 family)
MWDANMTAMISSVAKILAVVVVAYIFIVFLAWRFQERLAFPGPRRPLPSPTLAGLSEGQRVTVVTSDQIELHGWYLPPIPAPPAGGKAPGLLWFYGNMETVGALGPIIRDLRPPETGVLILDYRGYGQSEGKPTEEGLYRDAEAAWAFLTAREEIDSSSIAVYGRSLGSAPALHLAASHPVRSVVLDSPFSNAREMAAHHYRFLPRFFLRLSLDNLANAEKLEAPLLIFHGSADRIVPFAMGQAVAAAGRAREFIMLEGAGHNDTYYVGGSAYRAAMHNFLATTLSEGNRE